MANATIQFTKTDDYILVPSSRLQLSLHALPPAGASLELAVYAAPLGQDGGARQVAQARIDNLGGEPAAPQFVVPLGLGLGYVFRLEGDARLLRPGLHAMTIGLALSDAEGRVVHDFGKQYVEATHALLDGLFYARRAD